MKLRIIPFFLLTVVVLPNSYADILGFRVSGGQFKYSVSGDLRDSATTTDTIDLKNDLHIADDSGAQGFVYIEHPVPLIPNVRLGNTSLRLNGTGSASINFTFNGQPFTTVQTLTTNVDLSHTELALYYEIIDTFVDIDIGLNFKSFGKTATISNGTTTASTDLKGTIPMLYAAINIPIPITGFIIGGEISTISVGDNSITDTIVRLRYDSDFQLGAELGYRAFSIKYEDTGAATYANIKASGPYINVSVFF